MGTMDDESAFLRAARAGLPHGPEFRFVDRLIALDPGVRARGIYWIRGDEPFLAGHFPGDPVMPGVLMLEAIAQMAGIAAQGTASSGAPLRLAAVSAAKIMGTGGPGARLWIAAEIVGRLGALVQAEGAITLGRDLPPIVTARITLAGVAG